jgi:hypothetical protein
MGVLFLSRVHDIVPPEIAGDTDREQPGNLVFGVELSTRGFTNAIVYFRSFLSAQTGVARGEASFAKLRR